MNYQATINLDAEIEAKAVVIREGAALRSSEELALCFIEDAQDLLNEENPRNFGQVCDDTMTDEEYQDLAETLEDGIREYDGKLHAAGYTSVWNDGYVIYKDLSDAAIEALVDC